MTVESPLLGSMWLLVCYLQPGSISHCSKLERALPITMFLLNNHNEIFIGSEFDTKQHHFWHLLFLKALHL